jgi:hypothetical protein
VGCDVTSIRGLRTVLIRRCTVVIRAGGVRFDDRLVLMRRTTMLMSSVKSGGCELHALSQSVGSGVHEFTGVGGG